MSKLHESLLILNFIGLKIESVFNILIAYGFTDLQTGISRSVYRKLYNLGIEEQLLSSGKYQAHIKKETSEIFALVHENYLKGIIDLYSFKQEYDSFFNLNIVEVISIQTRILNFKNENKPIINDLNWEEIKNLRNTILAHNLRDKKNNNKFANKNFSKFIILTLDFKKCLLYFTQMNILYQNFKEEFKIELHQAKRELILEFDVK